MVRTRSTSAAYDASPRSANAALRGASPHLVALADAREHARDGVRVRVRVDGGEGGVQREEGAGRDGEGGEDEGGGSPEFSREGGVSEGARLANLGVQATAQGALAPRVDARVELGGGHGVSRAAFAVGVRRRRGGDLGLGVEADHREVEPRPRRLATRRDVSSNAPNR